MNYTLHQLQVFFKVTQTKSITKAAEELHLSQPAVSIQLRNFQDQFDIPLTEIIGRQLYVTDFGKEIALAANTILNEVHAINYKTMAFKGQLSGCLKLAVVSTGKYVIPYFLSDFLKLNRAVELEMDVNNKTKVVKALKNNEVDFAFVSVVPKDIAIESEVLLQNKLVLVGNNSVEIDTKNKVSDLLFTTPLLFREAGSATRMAMEDYVSKHKIQSKMAIQLTSNEAVKQAIIAGLGISIMPIIGLKNELDNKQLKTIPSAGLPIITNWRLIWLKGKKRSPVASAFLEFIRKEKDLISTNTFSWMSNY
ncbi:LysR family transcriptional regulator [Flavobacterium crassostreae]|uniref:LysR family transcriptional regulator n=1 Tax=Flavobacterium crassostreae TaxID=1763534 RepID=A0A1B9E0N9_9FLAO|nr:LysR family transcriptional regulator [Flavobacterium crassostreae]OCB75509.1 LysR family transcriptional regulator [Flavobacterium crassostreae]